LRDELVERIELEQFFFVGENGLFLLFYGEESRVFGDKMGKKFRGKGV